MPQLQRFTYDPNKPIEEQLQAFLAGRNPYGTVGNGDWMNVHDPRYFRSYQSAPDESGTTTQQFESLNPDVVLHSGSDAPYLLYGQYAPVSWAPTTNPNGIPFADGSTGFVKPDNMHDYNNLYYDPKYGLVRDAQDYRDPDARRNALLDAGIMLAVGGAGAYGAIAGNMGLLGGEAAAGSGAGGGLTAGNESAGLLGADPSVGGGAGGAGGGAGLTPLETIPTPEMPTFNPIVGEQPWYQGMLNSAMSNPLGAARTVMGLYSMGQGLFGNHDSSGGGGGGLLGGSVAQGPIPGFDPLKAQAAFVQNPYLMQGMQNVPFMSGEPRYFGGY